MLPCWFISHTASRFSVLFRLPRCGHRPASATHAVTSCSVLSQLSSALPRGRSEPLVWGGNRGEQNAARIRSPGKTTPLSALDAHKKYTVHAAQASSLGQWKPSREEASALRSRRAKVCARQQKIDLLFVGTGKHICEARITLVRNCESRVISQ